MAFDPWGVSDSGGRTPTKLSEVRDTLKKRAAKRVVHVVGTWAWEVEGSSKLGDELGIYEISYSPTTYEYDCTCYHNNYGYSRARSLCSHVVAVMLLRDRSDGGVSDTAVNHLPADGAVARTPPSLFGEGPESNIDNKVREAVGVSTSTEDSTDLIVGPSPTNTVDPDNREYWGEPALPEWVREIRPHQFDAVAEAIESFQAGVPIVWMDAPTGSGKTLIGELVRRRLRKRAAYICTTKSLQDQALGDFSYARILKGRSNYPTLDYPYPDYTAGDCVKSPPPEPECDWCSDVDLCPYGHAKTEALQAQLAVLNTAYFLSECNYVGYMSGRELVIADECDMLEQSLMGFAEFRMTEKMRRELQVEVPKKGSHHTTIMAWLENTVVPAVKAAMQRMREDTSKTRVERIREFNRYKSFGQSIRQVQAAEMEWIRDNEAGPMVLKPLKVDNEAEKLLWQHGKLWLPMSATIISPEVEADNLGLRERRVPYHTVSVPMTFPVDNRPIYVAPIANMTSKNQDEAWPQMVYAIDRLMEKYPTERILVHTVSYALSKYLMERITDRRRTLTYSSADQRERVLQQYRDQDGAVLLAPSFDRGIDLKGDDCRVIIVAKVPYPYLGDRQVSARTRGPGGDQWYGVQTIRSLVQMTGRGVRSKDDWCHTYILDSQFQMNLLKKHRRLFPKWWMQALDQGYKTKKLKMSDHLTVR